MSSRSSLTEILLRCHSFSHGADHAHAPESSAVSSVARPPFDAPTGETPCARLSVSSGVGGAARRGATRYEQTAREQELVTVKLEQLLEHELSEKKRVGGAPTY